MEISLSSPIAEGRTAEIYAWQDKTILKLYRDWCPPDWVEGEATVARAIANAGIPSPAVGEIIEVNRRRGLIYERITGISMLQDMNAHPWTILKHARTLADLQVKINQLSIPGLRSNKEGLTDTIRRAPHLGDMLRERALSQLAALTDGDRVCHGDFHPGNVLITAAGPIVIDWMTASSGNPWADVARTGMILLIGVKGAGKQVRPITRLLIYLYQATYKKQYFSRIPDSDKQLRRWMPVMAAARLDEHIEPEREALIGMVRAGLNESI